MILVLASSDVDETEQHYITTKLDKISMGDDRFPDDGITDATFN